MWQRPPPTHGIHTFIVQLPFLCHASQFSLCCGLLHIEGNCIDLQPEDRVNPQAHVSMIATMQRSTFTLTEMKAILW